MFKGQFVYKWWNANNTLVSLNVSHVFFVDMQTVLLQTKYRVELIP